MAQQQDHSQHFATNDDAWSKAWGDLALRELGRRLVAFGLPEEQAATTVEQIWLFYSYEALPVLRQHVPMGIAFASAGDRPAVFLYLRLFPSFFATLDRDQLNQLRMTFESRFARPLGEYVAVTLVHHAFRSAEPIGGQSLGSQFAEDFRSYVSRKNQDYVGVFIDDLAAEFATVMDPETVPLWLETPNVIFAGHRPVELIDGPQEQLLRDVITRAKFNMSAA